MTEKISLRRAHILRSDDEQKPSKVRVRELDMLSGVLTHALQVIRKKRLCPIQDSKNRQHEP